MIYCPKIKKNIILIPKIKMKQYLIFKNIEIKIFNLKIHHDIWGASVVNNNNAFDKDLFYSEEEYPGLQKICNQKDDK